MRNSARYGRKLIYANKRGLSSKSRFSRTKYHYRVLAGAFLLLIGVLLLIRPIHEGNDDSSVKDIESREEDPTDKDFDHVSLKNTEEKTGQEVGKEDLVQGSSDRGDDGKAFEMSLPHITEEEDDHREINNEHHVNDEDLCDRSKYPAESELRSDQITILVNGFSESRISLLQKIVQTYSSLSFVHSIYILWGNTSTPDDFLDQWAFSGYGAPIYLVRQNSMSLNDRFLPRKYIKTRMVGICDDDITVDMKSLGFALDVWREDEARIVGFFPRSHIYDPELKSWLYVRHYQSYSLMLTKFMILATEYLFRYTCEMPAGVKEYVDKGMNCEDIAMNFLASSHSGKGPVLVEGNARDWGDPRNSAVQQFQDSELRVKMSVKNDNVMDRGHFKASALSLKNNHLKDRGDCITAFEKLWNGMKLHYSYSKAASDLENQIQCEKFGYLIHCDKSVSSRREAARVVGEHVISFSHRYAYATFLSSDQHINASILLAQSLRSSGTIHDLVLLFDTSTCRTVSESHVLYEHYDEVVNVNRSAGGDPWNGHGMLNAWLLLEYAKVVYLEVDSLVLVNLDHLFQLPEPAAAPQLFRPSKFSTALLVLKPSNETYIRLLQSLEKISAHQNSEEYLLNFFFDGWFQMPLENRLPTRYNLPVVFSKELTVPSWFDVNRAYEYVGPPMVVRYGDAILVSKDDGPMSTLNNNAWLAARLKLFEFLQENRLRPLESDDVVNWAPIGLNSSHQIKDLNWPPAIEVSLMGVTALASWERFEPREAFVTVLYGNQHSQFSVAGWAESFHYHHSFQSRPKTLLIVLSTLDPDRYQEHSTYFDEVRVVEPIAVNERAQDSFTLLHLWNQTDFDKLIYVAVTSLFMANCNSLLDYPPFAAAPRLFPPDTFSTQVMSIKPDQQTYKLLEERLISYEFSNQPVERFLNAHYNDWYQKSTRHRICPSYMVSAVFESHLQDSPLRLKVLNFDLDWLPDEEANVTRLWKKALCDLQPGKKPNVVKSLCRAV